MTFMRKVALVLLFGGIVSGDLFFQLMKEPEAQQNFDPEKVTYTLIAYHAE